MTRKFFYTVLLSLHFLSAPIAAMDEGIFPMDEDWRVGYAAAEQSFSSQKRRVKHKKRRASASSRRRGSSFRTARKDHSASLRKKDDEGIFSMDEECEAAHPATKVDNKHGALELYAHEAGEKMEIGRYRNRSKTDSPRRLQHVTEGVLKRAALPAEMAFSVATGARREGVRALGEYMKRRKSKGELKEGAFKEGAKEYAKSRKSEERRRESGESLVSGVSAAAAPRGSADLKSTADTASGESKE